MCQLHFNKNNFLKESEKRTHRMEVFANISDKTEDETVGWYHRLSGHQFKQTLRDGERQGNQVCYSPWGHKGLSD